MNTTTFRRTAIFSVILLLITSCAVQKRKYTGGYYVEFRKIKPYSGVFKSDPPKKTHVKINKPEKEMNSEAGRSEKVSTITGKQKNHSGYRPVFERKPGTSAHPKARSIQRSLANKSSEVIHKTPEQVVASKKKGNKKKTPVENDDDKKQKQKRRMAIMTGVSLLLMALFAAFAAPVITGVFVLGDPILTALNVTGAFSKFFTAVIGWTGIFILDVLVSVGIYKYYKDGKPKLALANGLLRLVYTAFLGVGIVQLLRITASASAAIIYNFLKSFNFFWNTGLIVFGLHLIALGVLYNNEGGKKWVNITIKTLLILAGTGYMIGGIGLLIAPNPVAFAALIGPIFLVPQILGEVLFAVWMLLKGGKN